MSARLLTKIKLTNLRDDKGATAVEYGLMVALIAIVIIAAVNALGISLKGVFETITAVFPS